MSADNGIYILKMKDQFRVIHAQAIENLYWSHVDTEMKRDFVPTRLVEYYGDVRYTRDLEKAMKVAEAMARNTYILEYGIKVLPVHKTWKQIVREAKALAPLEIEVIKEKQKNGDKRWDYDLKDLEKIMEF